MYKDVRHKDIGSTNIRNAIIGHCSIWCNLKITFPFEINIGNLFNDFTLFIFAVNYDEISLKCYRLNWWHFVDKCHTCNFAVLEKMFFLFPFCAKKFIEGEFGGCPEIALIWFFGHVIGILSCRPILRFVDVPDMYQ